MQMTPTPLVCDNFEDHDVEILTWLGLDPDFSGSCVCGCPIHGGDNPTGFSYNSHKKVWSCWTNHCHKKYPQNIVGLVMAIKKCGYKEACTKIRELLGGKLIDENSEKTEIRRFIRSKIVSNAKIQIEPLKDDVFYPPYYFLSRGFMPSTLTKFKSFYCDGHIVNQYPFIKPMYGRAVLPVDNLNGEIIGFTGRVTTKIKSSCKWLHLGFSTNNIWFGLGQIEKKKDVYIVEGPLDVLRMHEAGFKNCLGLLGTSLSTEKIKILLDLGIEKCNILLDPDSAGIRESEKISLRLNKYFYIEQIRHLKQDPGDMPIEELRKEICS